MNLTHPDKARSSNNFLFSRGDRGVFPNQHEGARSKPETSSSQFPRSSERARMLQKLWRSPGSSISLPWLTFEDNATPRKLLLLVKVRLEMVVRILAITRSAGTKSVTLHQRIKDGQRLQLLHSTKFI